VKWSVDRGKSGKYGDRTVQLCNGVWLGESVVNMGIGMYSCVMERG
jgi:hypothetical protein